MPKMASKDNADSLMPLVTIVQTLLPNSFSSLEAPSK